MTIFSPLDSNRLTRQIRAFWGIVYIKIGVGVNVDDRRVEVFGDDLFIAAVDVDVAVQHIFGAEPIEEFEEYLKAGVR